MHHSAPQAAGVQHVGLIHAAQLLAALHGSLKADAADALDLMLRVGHDVGGDLLAVDSLGLVLAEVHAADQLAHHDEVNALGHDGGLQGAGVGQLGPQLGGAVVGVQAHAGAQVQQAAFRALGALHAFPFGAAHGAQQHTVAGQALVQLSLGQRLAPLVNGAAAHVHLGVGEGVAVLFGDLVQHANGLAHDLGADAVAADDSNVLVHWFVLLCMVRGLNENTAQPFRLFIRPPLEMIS